jgi:hypothetical protein
MSTFIWELFVLREAFGSPKRFCAVVPSVRTSGFACVAAFRVHFAVAFVGRLFGEKAKGERCDSIVLSVRLSSKIIPSSARHWFLNSLVSLSFVLLLIMCVETQNSWINLLVISLASLFLIEGTLLLFKIVLASIYRHMFERSLFFMCFLGF